MEATAQNLNNIETSNSAMTQPSSVGAPFSTRNQTIVVVANVTQNGFYRVAVYNKATKEAFEDFNFRTATSAWRYAWKLRFKWGVPLTEKAYHLLRAFRAQEMVGATRPEAVAAIAEQAEALTEAVQVMATAAEPTPKPRGRRRKQAAEAE